ncbi:MAG: hypothetical protein K9J13_17300 [Saprospiraceae bacterium]|nr:hypothetical protein [Saprospiraceae bacterium]
MKTNENIQAKVLEVTPTEIKYKRFDNQDGPLFIILKSDVIMICYENGTKDIFNIEKKPEATVTPKLSSSALYIKGQSDARKYYTGYTGAGTGTLLVSLASPLIGLIPAISCSSATIKDKNLNYPNTDLMKNVDYYNGYTKKAKKIKQGIVWGNWGIALGVNLVAVILIRQVH